MDERSGAWREVERQSSFRQSSDRRSTAAEGSLKLAASSPPILGLDISLPMSFSEQFCHKTIGLLILSQSHQSFYSSASRQIHGLVKFTNGDQGRGNSFRRSESGVSMWRRKSKRSGKCCCLTAIREFACFFLQTSLDSLKTPG